MKIAILADNADNFVKPRAEGLKRMLSRLQVESKVFYDGLQFLDLPDASSSFQANSPKAIAKSLLSAFRNPTKEFLQRYWSELASYDVVVVVETVPTAYLTYHLRRVEEIRKRFPEKPIVLYSSIYLSTIGEWIRFLKKGNDYHGFIKGAGHYGLERYDWYLIGSATTDLPMPKGFQPLTIIGCDLNDGSLYPEQNGTFRALVDFERPNHMKERAIQILALEKTKTPYTVLHGRYPMAEIRKIYRQSSIYFLAHLEAFGLPIVEVQACGAKVYTPYAKWAWAHYHKPDLTIPGPGPLSDNFVVYNNQLEELCERIEEDKLAFDPHQNLERFKREDGKFLDGDMDQLRHFLEQIKSGHIHSRRHLEYGPLNDLIEGETTSGS
jgi:hypothetical protein